MSPKMWVVLGVGALAAGAGTFAAEAGLSTSVDSVRFRSKRVAALANDSTFTVPVSFAPVDGMSHLQVLASGDLAVDVSMAVDGGPMEIRVVESGQELLPGVIEIDPSVDPLVHFTFLQHGSRRPGCRTFDVEARALTTDTASIDKGTFRVTYKFDRTTSDGVVVGCPD